MKHIFITNDDGVNAPGIHALALAAAEKFRVTVIAPHVGRSSCSNALTLRQPLEIKKEKPWADNISTWSVTGTTGDCAKLALECWLKDDEPDLILSGINDGYNRGSDCLYSGTVAGAMEGIFHHIPAMAVSVESAKDEPFLKQAAAFAIKTAEHYFFRQGCKGILNLNIPRKAKISPDNLTTARLGLLPYTNVISGDRGPEGMSFVMHGRALELEEEGTDVWHTRRGRMTVTPLTWDQTDRDRFEEIIRITESFVD